MYCKQCGNKILDAAAVCVKCGVATGVSSVPGSATKDRVVYVLLGIFLGTLGIHNFYAGYIARAVSQLLITLLLGWLVIPWIAVAIWVLVEVCSVSRDAQGNPFS